MSQWAVTEPPGNADASSLARYCFLFWGLMKQSYEGGIDSWDLAIHLLLVSALQHGSHILRDELF